jgi:hypothetical protein
MAEKGFLIEGHTVSKSRASARSEHRRSQCLTISSPPTARCVS